MIHNGTWTSIKAAESKVGSAAGDRSRIMDAVRSAGIHGLTRDEIAFVTGISQNTVRPRCVELLAAKELEEAGEIRRTASGRAAKVLTVCLPNPDNHRPAHPQPQLEAAPDSGSGASSC